MPPSAVQGVVSAASGAGIIIGAYFAFYSTTKRLLREKTTMGDGGIAFTSGAVAAVGSSLVKVPIAVCIRSVQAGVYPDVFHAARSITKAAGPMGLFTVRAGRIAVCSCSPGRGVVYHMSAAGLQLAAEH